MMRFDEFLAGLPAGIQLFSLLQSNPALLKLMATIMGAAPRLAAIITRRPHVFDGLLDPALLNELPNRAYLSARLAAFIEGDRAYEDVLDRLRIFASEQKFLIGVRLLAGAIDQRVPAAPFPTSPISPSRQRCRPSWPSSLCATAASPGPGWRCSAWVSSAAAK
ncbi:hypothetical protein AJ88_08145 [Mesorhizobium amorphae CCBAU 01583]|nr:hypothetical protein AJ88_08145 [Mesorhizobium amorphae CCBAU 01583]